AGRNPHASDEKCGRLVSLPPLPPPHPPLIRVYAVSIFALAQWVSREKGTHQRDAADYFLASKALPWWAIGTSIIAANISAEQIIGMSGSGYAIGLAIASYEWFGALTLLIVAHLFCRSICAVQVSLLVLGGLVNCSVSLD